MNENETCRMESTALNYLLNLHSESTKESTVEELRRYLDEADSNNTINPLKWWLDNEKRFPHIAIVAKMYLVIPAIAIPNDRVETDAYDSVAAKRNCLSLTSLNNIIFLNGNYNFLKNVIEK